ncbi:MAG: WbqC family protein [Paludibacter sp.]|nr:WbqC family protein [Paludibacter sp.]MDD4428528.1 WbqC family protein [Paludibacter sp.]
MKLGIMQPYFFPYLGYFSLIKHTDRFILLDEVQFMRHGWIERNRILKPMESWQYIKVPLKKHSRKFLIKDILIRNEEDWKQKIKGQLQHYKKLAPYFSEVMELLDRIFLREFEKISALNAYALKSVCEYLGILTPIDIFSSMGVEIDPVCAPDEWALNICKSLGGGEYWNPLGGMSFFDRSKFEAEQIALKFQSLQLIGYDQRKPAFEPGLSIIDVMMFNSVDRITEMLNDYELF